MKHERRTAIGLRLPVQVAFEGKHWPSAIFVREVLNVGGGAAGSVDADEVFADFFVGGDGGADAFGDEELKVVRLDAVGGELPEAEGRRATAGEHDG